MNLKKLIEERGKTGMIIISDVDGVHTSPKGGAKISARPDKKFGTLFTLRQGIEVFELTPVNSSRQYEACIAGFVGEDIMEFYQFHTPDGMAVIGLLQKDLRIIIISGRNAAPVRDRFDGKLGAETYLGVRDKLAFFQDSELKINFTNVIFISDGWQDAPLLKAVSKAGGIAVATADGDNIAKEAADAQTIAKGGEGAFAELVSVYLESIR